MPAKKPKRTGVLSSLLQARWVVRLRRYCALRSRSPRVRWSQLLGFVACFALFRIFFRGIFRPTRRAVADVALQTESKPISEATKLGQVVAVHWVVVPALAVLLLSLVSFGSYRFVTTAWSNLEEWKTYKTTKQDPATYRTAPRKVAWNEKGGMQNLVDRAPTDPKPRYSEVKQPVPELMRKAFFAIVLVLGAVMLVVVLGISFLIAPFVPPTCRLLTYFLFRAPAGSLEKNAAAISSRPCAETACSQGPAAVRPFGIVLC